jgi:arabinogalactan oligomer/maltooligosaccharide transport system substrate-binding protein
MTNEENQTLRFTMRGQGPSNTNAAGSGDIAQSKALKALQQQAEFSSLQRVGGTYWDAATTFGTAMAEGNPSGKSFQALLNEMVTGITGEETTGDPEGAEVVEEVVEEVTEEAAEEVVDEATEEASEEAVEETTEEAAEEVVDEATEAATEESTTTDADASASN